MLESGEDYLEMILMLSMDNPNVRSIDIAQALDFSKPSVSVAMKKLKENGYIVIDNNGYITLTKSGKEIAEKIYERHVILTDWFISIGVNKETARKDACKIEHDLSDETFEAIKKRLQK